MKSSPTNLPLNATGWHYPQTGRRDLRIDFMRGLAMIIMVVAHIEVFSIFNLFTSERFGLVSGAEGFVIFAGVVLGSLYRHRLPLDGWITSIYRIWSRAWKLYLVSLVIILSIYFLALIPFVDSHELTMFTNRGANITYPLYPVDDVPLPTALNFLFYLEAGPHQAQVLGLYVVLMLLTPLAFAAFHLRYTWLFLACSWGLYAWSQLPSHVHLVSSNFENAFSVAAWQLIYFAGLAVGWFKTEITSYMHGNVKRLILVFCGGISLLMLFVAQNHTNPFLPSWAQVHLLTPETFNYLYNHFAIKNTLGPLRVLNDLCLLVTLYWLLTVCWTPFYKALGWYLVPIGQASLYVFIIHVYVVLLASQLVPFDLEPKHWVVNSVLHASSLLLLWWMTKNKIGMRFIPS